MSDLAQRLRNLAERTAMEFDDATATEAADRIESLERENRDIKYIACQLGEDKLELERELAEAQRDAGRYRFLREITEVTNRTVDEIDAEIDAAIRGMK